MMELTGTHGAVLTINLPALVGNYQRLRDRVAPAELACVVKADAYGLGARSVVPALVSAGCHHFFVAHLAEALAIRDLIPSGCFIHVLNGLVNGAEALCADQAVIPVLNSLAQAHRWRDLAVRRRSALPAILQVDSGMSRLGVPPEDAADLSRDMLFRRHVPLRAIMSHLACADEPDHRANERQRERFGAMASLFPGVPRSLANSGGCLLDAGFHNDIARSGLALYGADPTDDMPDPFAPVVGLAAYVIQIRAVGHGTGVGYGHDWQAQGDRRLATLSVGYADGWPRSLSNRGAAWFAGRRLPIAGRVSMDSMTVDISDLPPGALKEGDLVELIGSHQRLEDVARDAGTIAYEILTRLGPRYERRVVSVESRVLAMEILP